MRLIDADKLKETLLHYNYTTEHNQIFRYINEQPTAYSVDKVIKELEEKTDFLKDCTKYGNKNAKQQSESYSTMMMYEVAYLVDDLIEIVKQGGVTND